MYEGLESRRLLSASLQNFVLTVTGTNNADLIALAIVNGKIRVGESNVHTDFVSSQVHKIVIQAKGGNDRVGISTAITQPSEIHGGAGNDSLRGGGGVDALFGEDGNDNLEGGSKGDLLDGGKNSDTADYSARTSAVIASIKINSDGSRGGSGGATLEADKYASIEKLIGGSSADTLKVTGGASDDVVTSQFSLLLDGRGGNDKITFGEDFSLNYSPTTLMGGDGNDTFFSKEDFNLKSVSGGAGNDTLNNLAEGLPVNKFDGGSGKDRYDGGGEIVGGSHINMPNNLEELVDIDDVGGVTGNSLNNLIQVNGDAMTIDGKAGNDTIFGGPQSDSLIGGDGNDSLIGGPGDDTLRGGAGNDTLIGNDGIRDTLDGGTGTDKAKRDNIDSVISIESFI
jgi:Ca2+-binding RTX toxin-like protein